MKPPGSDPMKDLCILIVGDWAWPQYEEDFANGLRQNGAKVFPLVLTRPRAGFIARLADALSFQTMETRRALGKIPSVAKKINPDLILFWRPTSVKPKDIAKLSHSFTCVSYNNDDPFGPFAHQLAPWHHKLLWRHYLNSLKHYHMNLFYRPINVVESRSFGSRMSRVLLPYFNPDRDKPWKLSDSEESTYRSDVTFIGHFERDGRDLMLMKLVQDGFKVRLFGNGGWDRSGIPKFKETFGTIKPLRGDDYSKAISGAKVSLAFLSKINRDSYTRRCFEIPAIGGLLLAERTPELLEFFKEDEEACFFNGEAELLDKVHWLLANPLERDKIADAGKRRVWDDGHDLKSRTSEFISMTEELIIQAKKL